MAWLLEWQKKGLGQKGSTTMRASSSIIEDLEMRGIDPRTSRMLSERSTI